MASNPLPDAPAMNDRYTDWLEVLLFLATVAVVFLALPA